MRGGLRRYRVKARFILMALGASPVYEGPVARLLADNSVENVSVQVATILGLEPLVDESDGDDR